MAKKSRKGEGRRPDGKDEAADEPVVIEAGDVDEGSELVIETTALPSGASPLAREQELALELGLALTGLVVGALTGFGQVPLGAHDGNVPAAMLGAVLGGLIGLNAARSLFYDVAQQWVIWSGLAALCTGSFALLTRAGLGVEVGLGGAAIAAFGVTVGMFVHRARVHAHLPAPAAPASSARSSKKKGAGSP